MLSTQPVSLEAGRQRQGRLWSNLKEVCDLLHLPPVALTSEELLFQHVQFKTGQRVHTIGQPFDMLYVVNSGFLKTVLIDEFGNEQVLAFPMKGDLMGVDGIHNKTYSSEAVALSDCDLILLPFKKLTTLGRTHVELENMMYGVMSRELVREQAMIGMLGALSAEARVARFLVTLSERFSLMGYSSKLFNLRMTRHGPAHHRHQGRRRIEITAPPAALAFAQQAAVACQSRRQRNRCAAAGDFVKSNTHPALARFGGPLFLCRIFCTLFLIIYLTSIGAMRIMQMRIILI
jgi:CRP/FNR family transcriptional regulator